MNIFPFTFNDTHDKEKMTRVWKLFTDRMQCGMFSKTDGLRVKFVSETVLTAEVYERASFLSHKVFKDHPSGTASITVNAKDTEEFILDELRRLATIEFEKQEKELRDKAIDKIQIELSKQFVKTMKARKK